VAVESGAEVARLTVPDQARLAPFSFSADGSQLAAVGQLNGLIYVWDLRALRAELRKLELDWDWPELPPRAAPSGPPPRIEVQLGK
jgi:hypothetical protein